MNKDEALKMAIEAMEMWDKKHIIEMKVGERWIDLSYAINACKEALEQPLTRDWKDTIDERIARDSEFKEALEQTAQEPVAYMAIDEINGDYMLEKEKDDGIEWTPLYTHPHQWQGLTDDEIHNIADYSFPFPSEMFDEIFAFARAIEQALKEKNCG